MTTAVLSDKYKRRAVFLMFWSALIAIAYILLLTIPIKYPVSLLLFPTPISTPISFC
jgi:phosphate/sulfate permease